MRTFYLVAASLGDVLIARREAYQLMMLEHLDTLAETSAKAISNIKFDKVVVWEGGGGASGAANFLQSMAKTLPPMMQVMRDIGGVELPGFVGKLEREDAVVDEPTPPVAKIVPGPSKK